MSERRRPRALPAVAAAAGAVLGLGAIAGPAEAKTERTPDGGGHAATAGETRLESVRLSGMGWGHGRGLSQLGAQRRAQAGQTLEQILDFYYPGTDAGTAGGSLRILISDDGSSDLVVQARRGLVLERSGRTIRLPQSVRTKPKKPKQRITTWRVVPTDGDGGGRVDYRTRAGWHRWKGVTGEVAFSAGGAPVRLITPSGSTRYRGVLRQVTPPPGRSEGPQDRDTINVVPMETYLRGVVAEEIPASWEPAAVRAQAVAARTYAAFERAATPADRHYDLCSTAFCQVYGGYDAENALSDAAIEATDGRVIAFEGEPAFAQFSRSNGGYTVAGPYPYLVSAPDSFDPAEEWEAELTAAAIEAQWPEVAPLASIEVTERDGVGEFGGRALRVVVSGESEAVTLSGEEFMLALGLKSTMFQVEAAFTAAGETATAD